MQFAHALDGMVFIVDIFAQIHPEVGMMPVGVVALVLLPVPSLGAAA